MRGGGKRTRSKRAGGTYPGHRSERIPDILAPWYSSLKRIVLHWPRLGPYHLARLRGAHELFCARGVTVTALEIAGMDRTYGWKKEEQRTAFERRTLFPDSYYEDLGDAELKKTIYAALDELSPDAVAINGYAFRDSRICLDWCASRERKAILMSETTAADKPRTLLREVAKRLMVRRFGVAICGGMPQSAYTPVPGSAPYRVSTTYDGGGTHHVPETRIDTTKGIGHP